MGSLTAAHEQLTSQSFSSPFPQVPFKEGPVDLAPPIPDVPIRLTEEASTSSSSGYSPSPPVPEQEMNQPINLSNLLTLPGHGRGHGFVRGHEESQGHGRRATALLDVPPCFAPEEVVDGHRDKCPRLDSSSLGTDIPEVNLTSRRSSGFIPIWAPRLSHGNCPVSVRDSADSEDTALALSQVFLLPKDMQKEVESSPDKLAPSWSIVLRSVPLS